MLFYGFLSFLGMSVDEEDLLHNLLSTDFCQQDDVSVAQNLKICFDNAVGIHSAESVPHYLFEHTFHVDRLCQVYKQITSNML